MTTLTLAGGFEPITLRGSAEPVIPVVSRNIAVLVSDRLPTVQRIMLTQSVQYKMNLEEHMIFNDALAECTVLRKVLVRE